MNFRFYPLSALILLGTASACTSIPEIGGQGYGTDRDEDRGGLDGDGLDISFGGSTGKPDECDDCYPEPPMSVERCGDGLINQAEELCDDGGLVDGDGCSSDCQEEQGWICAEEGKACAAAACGDGFRAGVEECDDGNAEGGDGCTANCVKEELYDCPPAGGPCVSVVKCGDRIVQGDELCDDGNKQAGDGCAADCLSIETGWDCSVQGARCSAVCGDGLVRGREQCDHPADSGCTASCRFADGYTCMEGSSCTGTTCGDNVKEGTEACDDGNTNPWDGCNSECVPEPSCPKAGGACSSTCGDGMILPGDDEQCDDGNSSDGDGCDSSCRVEDGFECELSVGELPELWSVPVVYRDFNRSAKNSGIKHPDFESFSGSSRTKGLVLDRLDAVDGLPVFAGNCVNSGVTAACPYGRQLTSKTRFDQWYRTDPIATKDGIQNYNYELRSTMELEHQGNGVYKYTPASLFPLNGKGFVAAQKENADSSNNFGFTTELRGWFTYEGGERLEFSGDDDVWVFINGRLTLDLGGLHSKLNGSVDLLGGEACSTAAGSTNCTTDLGLVPGKVYEIALFHAERHTGESNFNLTLAGFLKQKSECHAICGDGIVTGDEVCDDTVNDGTYGSCAENCLARSPYCGDRKVQAGQGEQCDDGVNTSQYGGCASGCVFGPSCGDGKVQPKGGEQCDDGANIGGYNQCAKGCVFDIRCGDNIVQEEQGEQCDDGLNIGGYGLCQPGCQLGPRCGDKVVQSDQGEQCDDGNLNDNDGCNRHCKRVDIGPR